MIVTAEDLAAAKTEKRGYSKAQIAFAQKLTGKSQWRKALLGRDVSDKDWNKFLGLKKTKREAIQEWKQRKKEAQRAKQKAIRIKRQASNDFYTSLEWRNLRVNVLQHYSCSCMMCGRSPREHGIVVHVDHIKPRSKFPELALDFGNLQILCEDCNKGKGDHYETDWRPSKEQPDLAWLKTLQGDEQ